MFELRALKARHGDCLILSWGTAAKPVYALIDGGPAKTYKTSLKPTLTALAAQRDDRLPLALLMVSHVDEDHIKGILDFAGDPNPPAEVEAVWFNSMEGLLDHSVDTASIATATASMGGAEASDPKGCCSDKRYWGDMVLASVPQGQALGEVIKTEWMLQEAWNEPYSPIVMAGLKPLQASFSGLKLTVVAPHADAVEKLRKAWKTNRKEIVTAAYNDDSPYNLSSIVIIAEFDGRSMLLTGDALGSHIIEGLDKLGRLKNGKAHFDLMKLPHHGSPNNVTEDFFRTITADHYVVSGDGVKFPNPHLTAMQWLADARQVDGKPYTVYATYDLEHLRKIFGNKLVLPKDNALYVAVSLPPKP